MPDFGSESPTAPASSGGVRRALGLLGTLCGDAASELAARWREHLLTGLGVAWGAAAVVMLLSWGAGFYRFMDLGFKKTGERYLSARGEYTSMELGGRRPGRRIVLVRDDLERVRAGVASARYVAAEYQATEVVARTAALTRSSVVSAATQELRWIKVHRVAHGRFYDAEDDRHGRPVAVLGASLADRFFPDRDPLGGTLQLDGHPFRVVGVLERKGAQFVTNNGLHDDMVFVPLGAGQRLFGLGDAVGQLLLDPWQLGELEQMRSELRAVLAPHHHIDPSDDGAIATMAVQEFAAPLKRIGVGLEVLLGFIGTIVLAIAGVGVANRMVAIVNARRRELAMRRACGARGSDLTLQLSIETLAVVVSAGAAGVALGAGCVWLTSLLPMPETIPAPRVEWSVLATAFVVLTGVGLASGVAPARTASRVDPASALRVL